MNRETTTPEPEIESTVAPPVASPPPPPDSAESAVAPTAASPEVATRADAALAPEVELAIRNQPRPAAPADDWMADLAAAVVQLINENLERMTPPQVRVVLDMLRSTEIDMRDYLSPDFWQGVGMVLSYQIKEQAEFVQRRLEGNYHTDPYGMDRELIDVVIPFLQFMYHTWWRVTTEGLEHVPEDGRALLVSNHSGVLPWDGAMIATAIYEEHPSARIVRSLFLHWFSTLPVVAPTLSSLGQVPGIPENAIRLLEDDELVCVFPEGLKGVSKLFKHRYRLARFGRGGFVQTALRTGAPIVPVAVVGAEEMYPVLANATPIARLLKFPFFPLTPFFPWLGLLGTIPLPTRWSITFAPPISTAEYGPEAADDPLIVFMLAEQVRSAIQTTLDTKAAARSSVF